MRTKQVQEALQIFPELKDSTLTKRQMIVELSYFKGVKTFEDNSNEFIFYSNGEYFAIAAYDINTKKVYLNENVECVN